jgi:hypothetical protein
MTYSLFLPKSELLYPWLRCSSLCPKSHDTPLPRPSNREAIWPATTKRPTLVSGLLDPGYLTPPTWSHVRPIPRHSPPSSRPPSPKLTNIRNQLFWLSCGFYWYAWAPLSLLTWTKNIMQYLKKAMLHVATKSQTDCCKSRILYAHKKIIRLRLAFLHS